LTYFAGMLTRCRHYVFALASILFLSACVPVPVRMPPTVKGPAGAPVGTSPDYSFISPHQTTREEVFRRLGWTDVGLNDSRLFWGRWDTSAKGRSEIMIFPQLGTAGKNRVWISHNILVEFDENGVVVTSREVEDKSLTSEFISWAHSPGRKFPNSSLLAQKSFVASYIKTRVGFHYEVHGHMSVRQEGLEFIDQDTRGRRFQVTRDRIASFELNPIPLINRTDTVPDPIRHVELKLKLKDKTVWGKKVSVYIDLPLLLAIIQELAQKNPLR
jgi:hypothetical protein